MMDYPAELSALWEHYLEQERRGLRDAALATLQEVLPQLEALDEPARAAWVEEVLRRKVDEGERIPIRVPLFDRVLYPVLSVQWQAGDALAAKRLAQLVSHVSSKLWGQLPGQPGAIGLWQDAYDRNPGDEESRQGLVRQLAGWIQYTLHEIPAGVLVDSHGASPEECAILQSELELFESLLRGPQVEQYRDLVARAAFHYGAYAEYRRHYDEYESYPHFLSTRGAL
jgi:hypothetical protein